jgi:hypothetical protein
MGSSTFIFYGGYSLAWIAGLYGGVLWVLAVVSLPIERADTGGLFLKGFKLMSASVLAAVVTRWGMSL